MSWEERPRLRALADRVGILPSYWDLSGVERHTSVESAEALLLAMGLSAATEAEAEARRAALDQEESSRLLSEVVVAVDGAPGCLSLRLPSDETARTTCRLELTLEDGSVHAWEGAVAIEAGAASLPLPLDPPHGYHQVRVSLDRPSLERATLLIRAPLSCPRCADLHGDARLHGITTNLYALRSARNAGVGDAADLESLVDFCARQGGAFVGTNPLHALRNTSYHRSPYSPISRLFGNPIYIALDLVPELADSAEARALLDRPDTVRELEELRSRPQVDYERAFRLKTRVLEALYAAFRAAHLEADTPRGRAFRRFREDGGQPLWDFATFMVLESELGGPRHGTSWRTWPQPYRDPGSAAVTAVRTARADRINFHCFLQFELDRQLGLVAEKARARGLSIGLYHDLALGSAIDGSDAWSFPGLFVAGAELGAPPDAFTEEGQDWGLPAIHPLRLRADRYRYVILLLRAALRHAGGLRIDHVMGMLRQFWIPAGGKPSAGAYVRYPLEDLLGILALEATRAGALIVGEDLGVVPEGFGATMARHGLLCSRVLYFQRDGAGGFTSAGRYPVDAMVTANTHDMAPILGYWQGRDVELRQATGLIGEESAARDREARKGDRVALLERLREDGALPAGEAEPDGRELVAAIHAFLASTPSALVGLSLDDIACEVNPVNVPGVGTDRYPCWSRRMRMSIEEIAARPECAAALRAGARNAGAAPAAALRDPQDPV